MLVVGAASRDVVADDPRGWRLGGAVAYASLTLARLGLSVRALVGADALATTAEELETLTAAGVGLQVVHLERGPVFENVESPGGRRQHCLSDSSPIASGRLPTGWARAATAVFLAPVADELSDDWHGVPNPEAFVALGWQGLLRRLVPGCDVELLAPSDRPIVRRANLIGLSVDDVGPELRMRDLVDLISVGSTLAITKGDRGGTLLTSRRPARSALRAYPAIPSNGAVDPTGAGDVFLAALFATAIAGPRLGIGSDWSDRLAFAAAAGSLAVEGSGLAGVPSVDAIRRRLAEVA